MKTDLIRSLIRYNPNTGELWLRKGYKNRKAGPLRLYPNQHGYLMASIDSTLIPAHRIAWLLHYGEFPTGNISFRNGDRTDLRISNLTKTTSPRVTHKDKISKAIRLIETGFAKSAVRLLKELL